MKWRENHLEREEIKALADGYGECEIFKYLIRQQLYSAIRLSDGSVLGFRVFNGNQALLWICTADLPCDPDCICLSFVLASRLTKQIRHQSTVLIRMIASAYQ